MREESPRPSATSLALPLFVACFVLCFPWIQSSILTSTSIALRRPKKTRWSAMPKSSVRKTTKLQRIWPFDNRRNQVNTTISSYSVRTHC
jgi:hypothetical protein